MLLLSVSISYIKMLCVCMYFSIRKEGKVGDFEPSVIDDRGDPSSSSSGGSGGTE
jgi:hypothetical protein